jgi:hypothetical protein
LNCAFNLFYVNLEKKEQQQQKLQLHIELFFKNINSIFQLVKHENSIIFNHFICGNRNCMWPVYVGWAMSKKSSSATEF